MLANLENSAGAIGLEKVSFHSNPKERQSQRMLKLPHNCTQLTHRQSNAQNSSSRLQQYMNCELPDVEADLENAEEPEIKLPTSGGSSKKQEISRKTSTSALLTTPKLLTVWIITNCGTFFKRLEYLTSDLPPEKSVCRSGSKS